jgi:hypothetical protein
MTATFERSAISFQPSALGTTLPFPSFGYAVGKRPPKKDTPRCKTRELPTALAES